jgi:hypothetical protein
MLTYFTDFLIFVAKKYGHAHEVQIGEDVMYITINGAVIRLKDHVS